jgi:hypothetical protein
MLAQGVLAHLAGVVVQAHPPSLAATADVTSAAVAVAVLVRKALAYLAGAAVQTHAPLWLLLLTRAQRWGWCCWCGAAGAVVQGSLWP